MGQLKTALMTQQYDDMGDVIKELKYINDFIEGIELPEVNMPEGFSGECND